MKMHIESVTTTTERIITVETEDAPIVRYRRCKVLQTGIVYWFEEGRAPYDRRYSEYQHGWDQLEAEQAQELEDAFQKQEAEIK